MKLHSFGKFFSLVALLTLVFALTFAVSITVNAESAAQSEIEITVIRDENDNFAKTDPTLVSAEGKVKLDWDKPEGALKYLIYRDGEHIVNSLSDHYVATLPLGVEVNFTVYAVDAAGNVLAVGSVDITADHSWNITVVAPTCVDDGLATYVCKHCDETKEEVLSALGHTAGTPVKENNVAPDCVTDGSYDTVVYCSVCDVELDRDTTVVPKLGHTEAAPVTENNIAPDCVTDGSYDTVVYCSVCDVELDRDTTVVPKLGHTEAAPVTENNIAPDCVTDGSYDTVVYCSVCDVELDRDTTVVPANGHTAGAAVQENIVEPTCTTRGSYDSVVYCTDCNAQLSKTQKSISSLGHTGGTATCTDKKVCTRCGASYGSLRAHVNGEAVEENRIEPDCVNTGSYDSVVYCINCNGECSRESVEIPALGHTAGAAVVENRVEPDCVNTGKYDAVVYCTVCDEELSRKSNEIAPHGHDFYPNDDPKAVIVKQICKTCGTEGEFVKVQFPPAYTTYAIVGACVIVIIICLIALAAPATTTPWYKRRRR